MRPKQFLDILEKELHPTVNPGKIHHVGRAASMLKITSGWKDTTPMGAAWPLFAAAGCPHTQYLDIVMWIKDRQADEVFNVEKDRPAWALAVLLTVPELTSQVQSIGFTPDGVIMVLDNKDRLKVFPKKMVGDDGKEIEAHKILERAHNATIIPGAVFQRIAAKLGLIVPGANVKALEKVFA